MGSFVDLLLGIEYSESQQKGWGGGCVCVCVTFSFLILSIFASVLPHLQYMLDSLTPELIHVHVYFV